MDHNHANSSTAYPSVGHINAPSPYGVCVVYVHVLQDIGAERGVYFLPAAQVGGGFVEQVAVAWRQQVSHEDDGRADGHQDEELTGPALVYVLGTLPGTHNTDLQYNNTESIGQHFIQNKK